MITLAIGGAVLTMFSVMFYLEDRAGVGLYDPSSVHSRKSK